MGSVKDLKVLIKPETKKMGKGRFIFSDRYSVFDWGEMPDHIHNKGAALCLMGAKCLEIAEEKGIITHYHGVVRKDGKSVTTKEINEPTNIMEVDIVRVIRPEFDDGKYDYSMFSEEHGNFLIPLEFIFRNSLPEGSSVFRRLKKGDITYHDLELDHYPQPGERLKKTILDVSTKLEETDRYISWKVAQKMLSLTDNEIFDMKQVLSLSNDLITEISSNIGLNNEDGKIELAYDPQRNLIIVDVLGNLDECRFTFDGIQASKEIARAYYSGSSWYNDIEKAKSLAREQGVKDWRELCNSQPPRLDPDLKRIISNMYSSAANAFLGIELFDSPPLAKVMKEYKEFQSTDQSKY